MDSGKLTGEENPCKRQPSRQLSLLAATVLIFDPAVCQEGNHFACRLSDRLHMSPDLNLNTVNTVPPAPANAVLRALQRLQQLHAGLGKPTTNEALYEAFQAGWFRSQRTSPFDLCDRSKSKASE